MEDVQSAAFTVNRLVHVPLTQGQFDALTDLVFNIGSGNFSKSTLLKFLNAGNFEAAVKEFPKWDRAGGKENAGLLRRRLSEEELFKQV